MEEEMGIDPDDMRWDVLFSQTTPQLEQLVARALRDYRARKTKAVDELRAVCDDKISERE